MALYNNTTLSDSTYNMTGSGECVVLEDQPNVILSHKLSLYSCLLFVVIGVIGNVLSMIVFTNKDMRGTSSNIYLLALAISDTLYLICVFFVDILKNIKCFYFPTINLDIINRSSIICQMSQYFSDFFSDYSTCLILVFTIDRLIAVYLPMRFKELCTLRRARVVCICVFMVVAIAIAPYHFMYMGLYTQDGYFYYFCSIKSKDYEKRFMIMYISESLLFRIIPVIGIAILNVFIIVRVTKISRDHQRMRSSSCRHNKRTKKDEKNLQLTIMLILVSTSYVLLYIPVLVTFVIDYLERHAVIHVSPDHMLMAENYTRALYVFGFAINFFLYTISGQVFREQLQLILHCTLKKYYNNSYIGSPGEKSSLKRKPSENMV